MAEANVNKLYNNFVHGMVTEASALTYPENSTIAEDNMLLSARGNRFRRLGINREPDGVLQPTSGVNAATLISYATHEFTWETVANVEGLNFLVQQFGTILYFFDLNPTTLSSSKKSFSIDMTPFAIAGSTNLSTYQMSLTHGKGYLFVTGEIYEPVVIEYFPAVDNVQAEAIYITIRDFRGVDDGLANDQEPTTLTNEHKYNLMNQGWIDPTNDGTGSTVSYYDTFGGLSTYKAPTTGVISKYFSILARYPSNSQSWWPGKAIQASGGIAIGDFDPSVLKRIYFGNNRAPRGHFIVNAFNIDRTAVSGVGTFTPQVTATRPVAVGFAAGRVWYGCNNNVYFSQVAENKYNIGRCYQDADPTSEILSDLVATDGGVIPIPEATTIVALVALSGGMLVFASNGIWFIAGGQGGFSATDFQVTKINAIGTDSPNSIVESGLGVQTQIFWWSRVGIQAIQQSSGSFGAIGGRFDQTTITDKTIRSFYFDQIPKGSKAYVKGVFDAANNVIQWLYRSTEDGNYYAYDRVLNYDVGLNAFYPWSISGPGTPYITGLFQTERIVDIVDVAGNTKTEVRPTFIKYSIVDQAPDGTYKFSYGYFYDDRFCDWGQYAYTSFLETGYELLADAMRKKQTPVVYCYFRRTEEQVLDNGDNVTLNHPSECLLQIKWDWASSELSNKWSSKVNAYRLSNVPNLTPGAFDSGYPIVVTRNKVRGRGRAIQFRFEGNAIGYDFDLLGWSVNYSGVTKP